MSVRRALDTIFIGIVTIAFALSFENLILGKGDWTGGESGLRVSTASDSWISGQVWPYYVFLGLLVAYLVLYRALQRSRIGWAFRALRDDGLAAELSGVDVARYRILAGALGGAMLGLAGGLYVFTESRVSPSTFEFGNVDVSVLVMLAFGGIGSLLGPVVGAAAFTWLDQFLEALDYAQVARADLRRRDHRVVPRFPARHRPRRERTFQATSSLTRWRFATMSTAAIDVGVTTGQRLDNGA